MLQTFTLVNYVLLCGVVSAFGVLFNLINVIIFVKLGFSDTINISLLSLALADLGVVLALVGYSVTYNPLFVGAVSAVEVSDSVSYIAFGWPYACFSRIAGCMTAVITVERFLCVSLPLKVKSIVTAGRITTVAIGVSAFMFASIVPAFVGSRLGETFNPRLNRTSIGLIFSENVYDLENASLTINVAVQLGVFVVVVVFTVGLIQTFLRNAEWRSAASTSSKNTAATRRDKKLVKMVIVISVVFIVFSVPGVVATFLMMLVKEYNIAGRYRNFYIATFSVLFPIGAINSTVNIFIFLDLSSKYRRVFVSILKRYPKTWNQDSLLLTKQTEIRR
ncbi:unnamed protein product [Lymnaea stagnalis]|uniref:G-protein coupled receptors family 1 profile domain-containing protein n=1 Tax=Lymnaea stagnalis TaxID=6523 RepID=A0AAV2HZU9_LYMST